MGMDRRNFLQFLTFTPPTAALANKLVAERGGEVGLGTSPLPEIDAISGIRPGIVDRRDDALYDVLRITAGTRVPERWPFFSAPVGYNRPGSFDFKLYSDTNMRQGNQLECPRGHVVHRILFLFSPAMVEADRNALAVNYFWELQVLQKVMARAPIARCATVGEPRVLFNDWAKNRCYPQRNGRPVADQFCMHLKKPLYLPPLVYFSLVFNGQPFVATGDMEFFVLLDGVGDFPVQ
jgi:hypothetical protein